MARVRQNSTHRPFKIVVFTESALVDFPTEFPGGVVFKMVDASGATIAAGAATGDGVGRLSYQWQSGELAAVTGAGAPNKATFTGTDAQGRTETFPTGTNIEIEVIAAL